MYYDRKDVTKEEAEKEYWRIIASEEGEDDEHDETRIDDLVKSYEKYIKDKNNKK